MKQRERSPWHRDDLPAWAWGVLIVVRAGQLAAALLPLALIVLLWWTWTHRREPAVQRALREATKQVGAVVDSARSRVR